MISPPRSLSVAFLRMMQARGDFVVMNEPSQWAYDKIYYKELCESWFKPDTCQTFDEVKTKIFKAAQNSYVFVKEMSFAVEEFLLNDDEMINNPNVHFVFLLRNPHHSVISFYKKSLSVPNGLSNLMGYRATYNIFEKIKNRIFTAPFIISTEDLYREPKKMVQALCDKLDIEFKEESLNWENLGNNFEGQEWHETKYKELTHLWHGEAIKSSGFGTPTVYEIDAQGKPTFSEIGNIDHRKAYQEVYEENLHYYEKMMQDAEFILKPIAKNNP